MITVKILGSGCANCKRVEETARRAAQSLQLEADFVKVTQYEEIMKYPILATPGLVINEKVFCSGRIPTQAEVAAWLTSTQSAE